GGASSYQKYHFGDSIDTSLANYWGDKKTRLGRTCKVASYKANGFGLYDMHGNVREWCLDWYAKDYYGTEAAKVDPQRPSREGATGVIRAGGWSGGGGVARSADRVGITPEDRGHNIGFRVALVPSR